MAGPTREKILDLSSRANAHFKRWASLLEARGIREHGQALVSGPKLVAERLAQDPRRVQALLLPPEHAGFDHPHQFRLSAPLFKELDVIGTRAPLAVVQAPAPETFAPHAPQGLEIVLALSDPGNLGAALRSAEAFGAERVILTTEAASPYLPKAIRAAAGATWRLKLCRADALAAFAPGPHAVVGLDLEGEDLRTYRFPPALYLVLGEEGRGLPAHVTNARVRIAMAGSTESLNALAAFSIALYAYRGQHAPIS